MNTENLADTVEVLSKYKPDHLKKAECFSENKLASNTILTNAPWEYYT